MAWSALYSEATQLYGAIILMRRGGGVLTAICSTTLPPKTLTQAHELRATNSYFLIC
jgi:hypothetical protein